MPTNIKDKIEETRFRECDTCSQKSGSPILCKGCLHNRKALEIISKQARGKTLKEVKEIIQKEMEHWHEHSAGNHEAGALEALNKLKNNLPH